METKTQSSDVLPNLSRGHTSRPRLALTDLRANVIFWFLTVGGLVLDLWSKKEAFAWLEGRENREFTVIDDFLSFRSVLNDGAAWNLLGGKSYLLSIIAIVALTAILVIFFVSRRNQTLIHIALGFLAAGVSGNLYDRIFNAGHVRDFIDVHHSTFQWPIFNVADSLLCVGVGLLIISNLLTDRPDQKHAPLRR
jgi:signal peptidase II